MIKFKYGPKNRNYGTCDSCRKEGFRSYSIILDPPLVVGAGYWYEIECQGFDICDDCAKKFIDDVESVKVKESFNG